MSSESEGVFKLRWNIGKSRLLSLRNKETTISSLSDEAELLKRNNWFLTMCQDWEAFYLNGKYPYMIVLHKYIFDTYEKDIPVSIILDIIDSDGIRLQPINEIKHIFSKISNHVILNCLSHRFLEKISVLKETDELIIHCHITDESHKQAVTCMSPTVIQTQMCSFKWKIKIPDRSNWLEKIKVPFDKNSHFDIIIMPASEERIKFEIEKTDLLQPYKLKTMVLNDEDFKIDITDSKYLFEPIGKNQKFECAIEKSQVVDKSCSSLSYSFTLICFISTFNGSLTTEIESYPGEDYPSTTASRLPLQEDLKDMLLSEKHSDVKLRAEDQSIPAHKCLLSVRSPVFATMFDQDMLESKTGIVNIPDVESETLRSFLEFLYTDTITNTDYENVLKLLLVADKYQVNVLKERCSKILMSKLSMENICEVVFVADMVNQQSLKLFAISFIKTNKKAIFSSTLWPEWMEKNMKLANEILFKLMID